MRRLDFVNLRIQLTDRFTISIMPIAGAELRDMAWNMACSVLSFETHPFDVVPLAEEKLNIQI
jgi:hypothetical protein